MDTHAIAKAISEAYVPTGPGRPSAIADAASLQIFLAELERGCHMEPAAEIAGITPNTIRAWLKRGEEQEYPFDLFLRAYKRARASVESRVTQNIIAASEKPQFWAAGATYLERTHPDRWGKRSEDTGGPKVIVQIGVKDSDVQIATFAPPPSPLKQLDE